MQVYEAIVSVKMWCFCCRCPFYIPSHTHSYKQLCIKIDKKIFLFQIRWQHIINYDNSMAQNKVISSLKFLTYDLIVVVSKGTTHLFINVLTMDHEQSVNNICHNYLWIGTCIAGWHEKRQTDKISHQRFYNMLINEET